LGFETRYVDKRKLFDISPALQSFGAFGRIANGFIQEYLNIRSY